MVGVLIAACSPGSRTERPAATATEQTSASPSPVDSTPADAAERCGDSATTADTVRLVAGDGTGLAAAHAGSGKVGVVLGHQYPSDLCDWWFYASHLAGSGFNVVAIDFRCYGESECPEGGASGDLLADIEAAIEYLRGAGAERIFYMGASMGGTVAYAAGSKLSRWLTGAINLSGGGDFTTLTQSPFVDAPRFAPGVEVPFLSVAARGDLPGNMLRSDFEAVPESDKQLVMLPSIYGHGVAMLLGDTAGEWSRLDRTIRSWLRHRS
ncbi:hypothetical protein BH20ACT23_BH20ACT23_21720 [soil metagenome]